MPATPEAVVETALQRVAQERARLGLSLSDMAERARLDRERFAAIESGDREPSILEFVRIAQGLDMHPADLVR